MFDEALYDKLTARIRVDENGCWIWTGPKRSPQPYTSNCYGMTHWNGRSWNAHRAMMVAIHGPRPSHILACHHCDVALCVNPEHLFWGTMKDNIQDSRVKGRHYEGKRDYCEHGHPLSGENLKVYTQKGRKPGVVYIKRTCLACHKAFHSTPEQKRKGVERNRRYRAKKRALLAAMRNGQTVK